VRDASTAATRTRHYWTEADQQRAAVRISFVPSVLLFIIIIISSSNSVDVLIITFFFVTLQLSLSLSAHDEFNYSRYFLQKTTKQMGKPPI
jgi:hypothetical protein